MRVILFLLALAGAFILVAMLVAPSHPPLRDWYLAHACPYLDRLTPDICAEMRRGGGGKAI